MIGWIKVNKVTWKYSLVDVPKLPENSINFYIREKLSIFYDYISLCTAPEQTQSANPFPFVPNKT